MTFTKYLYYIHFFQKYDDEGYPIEEEPWDNEEETWDDEENFEDFELDQDTYL